jgi:mannose-6-phosphate isomerase-like protein (cupin superfamily)
MRLNVVKTNSRERVPTTAGTRRDIITATDAGARDVRASLHDIEPNRSFEFDAGERAHLLCVMEGSAGQFSYKGKTYPASKGTGVYLEPGEKASVSAGGSKLLLIDLHVPPHTAKPTSGRPAGYFFDNEKVQALIDAGNIRIRTFWVNKETGMSDSWHMQAGLMNYTPEGHSPRHVHRPTPTNPAGAVHFYFVFEGQGIVKDDDETFSVTPGDLVLIPANEWHQLKAANGRPLVYMEFQGPFDFSTTMDNDPLGKDWYIKGTDDGTGHPVKWVQS